MGTRHISRQVSDHQEVALTWTQSLPNDSRANVQCLMGYIVDLTVILDQLFRSNAGSVSDHDIQSSVDRHARFGRRDMIHQDIRTFVAETFGFALQGQGRDLVLEKIIDLIRQNCVPLSTSTHSSAEQVVTDAPELVKQGNT